MTLGPVPYLPSLALETVLDQSHDCIKVLDPTGRLTFLNRNGRKALAIDRFEDIELQHWAELWPTQSRPKIFSAVSEAQAGRRSRFQGECPTRAGHSRWWDVSVSPICDNGGQLTHILATSRDVSYLFTEDAQKEVLRDLARQLDEERGRMAQARLEANHSEKLRLVGQFAGSIVHDLRNVLAVTRSAAWLLRRRSEGAAIENILNHLDSAMDRGTELVDQLLDISRIDSNAAEIVDLGDLIQRDAELLSHLAGSEINLKLELAPVSGRVLAPATKVRSVLFNLIANSRDAMQPGGTITIGVQTRELYGRVGDLAAGNYVVLSVSDDGAGMPPAVVERLGQPFFTTKGVGKGTGLGVPSAFDLASLCNGTIEISSTVGVGTTISIVLAVTSADDAPVAAIARPEHKALHGNATLLLVENDEMLRQHLAQCLRELGYFVLEAPSASRAIATMVENVKIDLMITDLQLDDRDCLEVAQFFRTRFPDLPTVFISGTWAKTVSQSEVLLQKPVSEQLLAQVVLEQLGRLPASHLPAGTLKRSGALQARLQDPRMVAAYSLWFELCNKLGQLPSAAEMEELSSLLEECGYLVKIIGSTILPTFRFVHAASSLEEKLGRPLADSVVTSADHDTLGSLGRAFARCTQGVPFFEFTRIKLPEGTSTFERLILPVSDNGNDITHLLGIVSLKEI